MYGPLIKQFADLHGLDPKLLTAVVMQESSGNPYAIRYEPAFFRKYLEGIDPKNLPGAQPNYKEVTPLTESRARAFSYGLCQVMGQTAREFGFKSDFLTELCDPETNLNLGARILAHHLLKTRGDVRAALLRWNGGSNKSYPDKVLARIK